MLWRLIEKSDVLVENFRPGAMDRLGFGYAAVSARRPTMVYCSISGFGNTGLMKDRPGYDVIVQGEAGIQDITGPADGAPYKVGTSIADLISGLNGSQAILAALYAAKTTGRGQHVSVSMYEAVASLLTFNASIYFATGESPKRRGNAHATIVPYETFEASDGWISLGVANDELWKRFCKAVERPELTDDPRFAKAADRVRNRDILVPIVKDIIKQRKRDEWLPLMEAAGIPSGAIRTVGEVCESALLQSRDMIAEMPHAGKGVGIVKNIKNPMHLSDTPLDTLHRAAAARRTYPRDFDRAARLQRRRSRGTGEQRDDLRGKVRPRDVEATLLHRDIRAAITPRFTAPHSITSSARASSVGGTSRPRDFAVLRLMTSSNLVGCMTGSSAGLAPLRMRPT